MKKVKSGIKEHAVIVVALMDDGTMYISSTNNGRSKTSKMADAIVKMAGAVIENLPVPSKSPSTDADSGGKS